MDTFASIVARADALVDLGRHAEALSTLAVVLASDPSNVEAHAVSARAQLALRDTAAARTSALEMIRAAPDDPRGHFYLALAEHAAGRLELAVEAARAAITNGPAHPMGYVALAGVTLNRKELASVCRTAADEALRLDPHNPDRLVLAAQSRMYAGRSPGRVERSEARALLEDALRADPTHLKAMAERAALTSLDGRHLDGLLAQARLLRELAPTADPLLGVRLSVSRMLWAAFVVICTIWVPLVVLLLLEVAASPGRGGGYRFASWALSLLAGGVVVGVVATFVRAFRNASFRVLMGATRTGLSWWLLALVLGIGVLCAIAPWPSWGPGLLIGFSVVALRAGLMFGVVTLIVGGVKRLARRSTH